jgi:hypothetical protein
VKILCSVPHLINAALKYVRNGKEILNIARQPADAAIKL